MIRHGYHLIRGKLDHAREDFVVAEKRKLDGHDLHLYAIFDGHSGRHVAQYLQSHLFDNILSQPDLWKKPKRAVRRAYTTSQITTSLTTWQESEVDRQLSPPYSWTGRS
ncbi:Probable protein phosphatase 2C 28 [Linum perenne]